MLGASGAERLLLLLDPNALLLLSPQLRVKVFHVEKHPMIAPTPPLSLHDKEFNLVGFLNAQESKT